MYIYIMCAGAVPAQPAGPERQHDGGAHGPRQQPLLRQPLLRQPQGAPGHVHLRRHAAHQRPRRQHRRQAAGPRRLLRHLQELHQAHGADRRAHRRQRPDQEQVQRRQLMIEHVYTLTDI
uniref:Uncharacterized protein n=1 Tax=Setaria italica TaxID=4555 RepID=K3XTI4_SETIT